MSEMMTIQPTIKKVEPMTVAFQVLRGRYDQIPEGYSRLYGWLTQRGHTPSGPPMAAYFTSPDTPESETVFELWAPIEDVAQQFGPDDSGLGIKSIGAQTVASATHVGPYEGIEPTYRAMEAWVAENGHETVGPPTEVYLSDPDDTKPEEYMTEIRFPIREP